MSGLFICLLFSMVSTGLSLLCIHCSNNVSASCTGVPKNCSQDQFCISTLQQTTYSGGLKTLKFERGCGTLDQCNVSGSISSVVSIHSLSACCSTNSCTPGILESLNVTKRKNSVQCPICLTHENDCFASKLTNCTGDEIYCASFEIKNSGAKTYIKGCASASFCQISLSKKTENGLRISTNCLRSASHCLSYPSLVLLFVVFLGKSIA
ncbi:uncharacterized protein [Pyxicephalus adspersus]|uniref:uncharacterized protein isoform X1 n=1 Tax=Pyxicephalus adspersus TaxID=30357 RepID=UPI003B5C518F